MLWLPLALGAAAIFLAAGFASCSEPSAPDPKLGPVAVIRNRAGQDWRIQVELARTPEEREKGLMWRWSLAPDHGMIFIFEAPSVHTFWMKNTRIPLDMIFISADRKIAGVVENAEPYTESPRKVDAPSQYVLEVSGGQAKAHGLAAGDQVYFFGIE